uniref:Polypeptide N-acetylgalactosaminyltransferase n=1 Tax=Heterorhabditis bacteriophora TaxID=37862 RepID=A0A1I7XHN1_HETBA
MFPARRRSLLLKILLLVPAVWFCALIYFTATDSGRNDLNMPKPRFVVDPNDPIYRKGDANQAGEKGKAVKVDKSKLTPEEKKKYDDGLTNNAFNQYASDLISIHRMLPDNVDEECKTEVYSRNLPNTSVIVCFHNEAWSVLLRTVHSVLERTPDHLLTEIILVDDFSDMEHTKVALESYMSQFPKVRILRMAKREGLIRARLRGAAIAKGTVLTYLDSHCECMEGWIEPLLDRIYRDPTTVVCPVIDVIDDNTFEYHYSKAYFTNVGGFDWGLQFNWHAIPERDRKNRSRAIDPVRYVRLGKKCMTPLGFGIAGALFQLRNAVSTQCLDSPVGEDAENKAITPYPCHEQGGNQVW